MTLLVIFCLFTPAFASAQSAYFQQEVNYTINVKLDDVKHELTADETIEYINNSPNDLPFLYFHLWPNGYKNNKTALAKQLLENGNTKLYYAKDEDRGYIDGLDFKVNGEPVLMKYMGDSIDICRIFLNKPLRSGERITITTPFHVKIPLGIFSRIGHLDQQYQITQWYPKPAVYDRNGWNPIPYLNQGEFYSEFGSYDVRITVPANYVVGATGDLVNGEKEKEWLEERVAETKLKNFDIKPGNEPDNFDSIPESSPEWKTLRYKQSKVHDFAWFCDKRYNVLKGEVKLPHSGDTVTTWVMFTNGQGKVWKDAIPYMNDAIYYYSLWNGDYAYKHATAVDGALSAGGGMEYPNITVIGESSSPMTLETVIMHEVGHNWFYGMLGSNERMHGWMDEGMNSANENRYIRTKYPDALLVGDFNPKIAGWFDLLRYKHKAEYEEAYLVNAKKNEDQPVEFPAWKYTQLNYAGVMYSKTAIIFDYLRAYLGDSLYDKCGQAYFEKWKFKHPMPEDLRKAYEETSGKNLDWLFDDLINTTKKLDYKIRKVKIRSGHSAYSSTLVVKNTGEIAGPFCVAAMKDGKVVKKFWFEGIAPGTSREIGISVSEDVDKVMIDPYGDLPEVNRNNNISKVHGIFKKTEPLKIQFLGSLDRPDRTQLYWSPMIGFNAYNGFMAGLVLYNNLVPEKKFEYILMPAYGFGNKDLAGSAELRLNLHPHKAFQTIRFGVEAKRYAYADIAPLEQLSYNKVAPYVEFDIKQKELRSPIHQFFKIREIGILKDSYSMNGAFDPPLISAKQDTFMATQVSYWINNSRTLHPYYTGLMLEFSKYYTKLSFESNHTISLKGKNSGIFIRVFAGTFLNNSDPRAGYYAYHLSGPTGAQDYLFDNVFLGRTESTGWLSQQFADRSGGFKVYTPYGSSKNWIASMNIKANIPKVPLVHPFIDIGTADPGSLYKDQVLYDAGLYLSMVRDVIQVYFPLVMSPDMKKFNDDQHLKYMQTVRFTFNIEEMNPFKFIRSFSL